MNTINKIIDFYENEHISAIHAVENPIFKPEEVINNAIQRCLGVALFAQTLDTDISYEDINEEYEVIRKKLETLLDK